MTIQFNARKFVRLVRSGNYRTAVQTLRRWWHDDGIAIGLAYDLTVPVHASVPATKMIVRELRTTDVPIFTDTSTRGLRGDDVLVRVNAQHLIESGIQTCYIGVTDSGPAYLQYLIMPDQNDIADVVFEGLFPPLGPNEALLEFAFTLERYRGTGVMPTGFTAILDIAKKSGVGRVISYVPTSRARFIGFYLLVGFAPFAIRDEKRRFFRRRITFERLGEEDLRAALRSLLAGKSFADPRKRERLNAVSGAVS